MSYTVDGESGSRDVLDAALLSNDEDRVAVTGTFTIVNGLLMKKLD